MCVNDKYIISFKCCTVCTDVTTNTVSQISRHLDFFEMVRNEDEKELSKKFETVGFIYFFKLNKQ